MGPVDQSVRALMDWRLRSMVFVLVNKCDALNPIMVWLVLIHWLIVLRDYHAQRTYQYVAQMHVVLPVLRSVQCRPVLGLQLVHVPVAALLLVCLLVRILQ
jgi:hypothetical protein